MAKIVAAVKTTLWGEKHGSLALVHDKDDYKTATRDAGSTIDQLENPALVNKEITVFSTLS